MAAKSWCIAGKGGSTAILGTEGEDSTGVSRDAVVISAAEAAGAGAETAGDEAAGEEAAGAFAITAFTRVAGIWMVDRVVTGVSGVGGAVIVEDEEEGSTGLP
jgi:hypothetical protein